MKEFTACMKNELKKIFAKKRSILLYGLTVAIVFTFLIIYYILNKNLGLTVVSGAYYPLLILKWMMSFILPLIIAVTVIDTITGEIQDESIKNALKLPAERYQIYLAKLTACLLYAFGMLFIIFLISTIGAALIDSTKLFLTLSEVIVIYIMAFLVLGLFVTITGLFALFFKSTSTALLMGILLVFALNTAGLYFNSVQPYLPTTYLSLYSRMLNSSMLLYMISYYIIFTILGIFKFQAKEV